jgi:hypothetical protein
LNRKSPNKLCKRHRAREQRQRRELELVSLERLLTLSRAITKLLMALERRMFHLLKSVLLLIKRWRERFLRLFLFIEAQEV